MKKTIETHRLILRHFELNDAADMYEYLAEPNVNCFKDMKINSVHEAEQVIQKRIDNAKSEIYFTICLKDTGKVIGEIFACAYEREEILLVLVGCSTKNFKSRVMPMKQLRLFLIFFLMKIPFAEYIFIRKITISLAKNCAKN